MTRIHLTSALLEPEESGIDWRSRLSEAGLLSSVSAPAADSPKGDIAQLQESLTLLEEGRKMAAETTTIELPSVVWWLVGGALLTIVVFAELLIATFGTAAIWIGLALAIATALFTVYDRNRRRADERARYLEARLIERIEGLLRRNFVIRLGGVILVSTPDLDALVLLSEAITLSDPNAGITTRIADQIARLQDTPESLAAAPGDWRRQNLSVDLTAIQDEIDALPPRPREESTD